MKADELDRRLTEILNASDEEFLRTVNDEDIEFFSSVPSMGLFSEASDLAFAEEEGFIVWNSIARELILDHSDESKEALITGWCSGVIKCWWTEGQESQDVFKLAMSPLPDDIEAFANRGEEICRSFRSSGLLTKISGTTDDHDEEIALTA